MIAGPTKSSRNNLREVIMDGGVEKQFILIRNYQPCDETECRKIIQEGIMATVIPAFFAALTREFTFEIIIIMAAFMFVFLGLSPTICLLSIPISVVIIYLCVYLSHVTRSYNIAEEVSDISINCMSSHCTGFWVAEVYIPCFKTKEPSKLNYLIINESQLNQNFENKNMLFIKRIVGTIAVTQSRHEGGSAWLRILAVSAKYQRKGIGTALVNEALNFCHQKGYEYVILVASECQDAAKKLSLKKGFELRQLYHKQFLGSLVQYIDINAAVAAVLINILSLLLLNMFMELVLSAVCFALGANDSYYRKCFLICGPLVLWGHINTYKN